MTRVASIARDAKLIALGKRLEDLQKRLAPVRAEHWHLSGEAYEYARRQTGRL
jgi:hypothetical protein